MLLSSRISCVGIFLLILLLVFFVQILGVRAVCLEGSLCLLFVWFFLRLRRKELLGRLVLLKSRRQIFLRINIGRNLLLLRSFLRILFLWLWLLFLFVIQRFLKLLGMILLL